MWFDERSEIKGWDFVRFPISETAENLLLADKIVNGEFRAPNGKVVRIFSAKRYVDNPNEIGIFVHTPDRCWIEGGWSLTPLQNHVQKVIINGVEIRFERRLFKLGDSEELVYFCGMVNGQQLPYRLDHHISIASRNSDAKARTGAIAQMSDRHFFFRLWESFTSRSNLSGPKHFIRISTPVRGARLEDCDLTLQQFLSLWLTNGHFENEHTLFRSTKPQ